MATKVFTRGIEMKSPTTHRPKVTAPYLATFLQSISAMRQRVMATATEWIIENITLSKTHKYLNIDSETQK